MNLKIGHLIYEIRPLTKDTPKPTAEGEYDGVCYNGSENTIYIKADQTPAEQVRILLHELIHAAWYAFRLPEKKLTEEEICVALESPLAIILRDNPGLGKLVASAFELDVPIVSAQGYK